MLYMTVLLTLKALLSALVGLVSGSVDIVMFPT